MIQVQYLTEENEKNKVRVQEKILNNDIILG
jgi:hypothetical protein